jgi:glycerol kinase
MSGSAKGGGPFLLGIDYGTESCRARRFDTDGRPLATGTTTYGLTHPRPGWAEQDPDEDWLHSEFENGRSAPKVDNMKAVDDRYRGERAVSR